MIHLALSLGTNKPIKEYLKRLERLLPPRAVGDGPVQETVIVAKDPEFGYNLAMAGSTSNANAGQPRSSPARRIWTSTRWPAGERPVIEFTALCHRNRAMYMPCILMRQLQRGCVFS